MENRILFITTKNLDYIRNIQEVKIAKRQDPKTTVIGSYHKSYFLRLLKVWSLILLANVKKYDIVWLGFAPQLVFPFLWKFRNKKLVIDFFISFYDTLCYDRKIFHPKSLPGRLLFWLDQSTLKAADIILCDTNVHKEYFQEEFGVNSKEYRTLYLEADSLVFYPRKGKRPQFLKGKYIVLYFGSILPLQGVEVILSAMEALSKKEGLHFFFIGSLNKKQQRVVPKSCNITYIPWVSQKELAEYIAMADLCLAGHFHKEIKKAARTIPGKAYIFHAMEKSMILGDNKANREIFRESEKIIFVPMGDAKALAEAIQTGMDREKGKILKEK